MNTLILDGSPAADSAGLGAWLARFAAKLGGGGGAMETIALRYLGLKPCTGCWSCWWATPGVCVHKDGMAGALAKMVAADLVVWGAPLVLGAQSALVKTAQDRSIPLAHPYIDLFAGECHHRPRYARRPALAFVAALGAGDDEADAARVRKLFERYALNMRVKPILNADTTKNPEEAADGIIASLRA